MAIVDNGKKVRKEMPQKQNERSKMNRFFLKAFHK